MLVDTLKFRLGLLPLLALSAGACGAPDDTPPLAPSAPPTSSSVRAPMAEVLEPVADAGAPPVPVTAVQFMHDDLPAALSRARREKKLLFIDAWATSCPPWRTRSTALS